MVPQSLAYASLAGLDEAYGLYSAYIGCFAYAMFGTVKVSPPTLRAGAPVCASSHGSRGERGDTRDCTAGRMSLWAQWPWSRCWYQT